ncbi:hypothetical protein N7490_008327 [Penicillium lividum]|nr:hypothetical protein N7490_008327 [Penicillium lividum]
MLPRELGFIGLGVMGYPMALNLLKKFEDGARLHVYDVDDRALRKFEEEEPTKVHVCSNAREVAESSSIADTATSTDVGEAVRQKSKTAAFYDAPVSGGSLGAAAGTLTFMLGCAEDDLKLTLLKDLLTSMGSSIFPCGSFLLGLTAKLCNNYFSGLIAIATAEAMNIGIQSGMNPSLLAKVFATSTAQSTINDKWNPVPDLMKKDFALAVEAADRVGAQLRLGVSGLQVYQEASEDERCRDLDSRVVFRYIGGDEDWETKLRARG